MADELEVAVHRRTRRWRLVRSLWVPLVMLGWGLFAAPGWLWGAAIARTRRLWVWAVVWSLAAVPGIVVDSFVARPGRGHHDLLGAWVIAVWFASSAHAVMARDEVLRRAAAREDDLAAAMTRDEGEDDPHELAERLSALTHYIRADPVRLPQDVQAAYDRVRAGLEPLVRRPDLVAPGSDAGFVVGRVIDDYLPHSLSTYLGMSPEYARTHRDERGRTAHEDLLRQLELIGDEAERIADATFEGDARALAVQTAFLEDRFGASSLRLPPRPDRAPRPRG